MSGQTRGGLERLSALGRDILRRLPWWVWVVAPIAIVIFAMYGGFPAEDRLFVFQGVIQGLVVGSIYVPAASGLSLTYGIKKFANFAHGDMMTVGAYAAFTLNVILAQHILLGFVFAIFAVALLGVFLELSIFRRLEGRGPVSALIASVGVSLVLQNVVSAIFTTNVLYLGVNPPADFPLGTTGLSFNT